MTIESLVEAAVVGTGRQSDRAAAALIGDRSIDELVARVDVALAIERRVLLSAGAASIYERAGRLAPTDVDPLPVSDVEVRPVCTASATALLAELLATQLDLLPEMLERIDSAGYIIAPALLPALLREPDSRIAHVLPRVMGARGRWLCALRSDCDWLSVNDDTSEAVRLWQEGRRIPRLNVLSARRASDPATAREWLAATWEQEKSEDRELFLSTFERNLSADDIAFLEAARADRSARVRGRAVRLLARIPGSETARRVTERADALLDYQQPSHSGGIGARLKRAVLGAPAGTLTVTPPPALDPAWEQDGIAKAPNGAGDRAYWLTEALSVVRPEHWEERFGASATELVHAAMASEWKHAVLHGWSRSAMLHQSGAWATVLWDAWREMELDDATTKYESTVRVEMITSLLEHLPRSEIETRVLAVMERSSGDVPLAPVNLFHAVPMPWSAEFGRRVLRQLAPHVVQESAARQWGAWVDALPLVAMRLPPDTFADALALEQRASAIDGREPVYRRQHERFRETLQLRQRIHEEIPT